MNASGSSGNHGHTLSFASMREECTVALGIATKIVLAFSGEAGAQMLTVDDGQVIRGIAFLRAPSGALCVAAGGDGKRINIYHAGLTGTSPEAQSHASSGRVGELRLVFSFGPHTKRITHVAAYGDTILFADKFGEVFRLGLAWGLGDSLALAPSDATLPIFILQHFSVMSTLFLSAPIRRTTTDATETRRLFTCDKDCHVRVSCYPDTFRIEQFLWTEAPQSVVTSIAEVPNLSEMQRRSYFVTGNFDGKVHLWVADNTLIAACPTEPFTLIGSLSALKEADLNAEGAAAVISVVYATTSSLPDGVNKHAGMGYAHGVLVAYANTNDVVFVPLLEREDDHRLSFAVENVTRTRLDSPPLAMVGLATDSALLLKRTGRVQVLQLVGVADQEAVIHLAEPRHAALETAVGELVKENGGTLLEAMNLFSQWQYDAVDPRTRNVGKVRAASDDVDDNNEDDGEDVADSAPVEDKLAGGKRGRVESGGEAQRHSHMA
ncbi:hypothetical protein TraAM80_07479 [Trypanosoma rangeli]|uniref:Uncharacterized protein n=1 Tax=Trypanosoma rangeli TaxID=5698 RepID=A0A422N539_TRYRA|nr:uncharacterized protein TraAM80_07479 [Trypanosoma rangeli]RNF00575.1 hypothetical protein TraAM80_07479 [Trypanosoma rangeli]|eukprot:RNF00575.1 hypothetical protein TraAM80_07479 [Trypanosoma rangeli]